MPDRVAVTGAGTPWPDCIQEIMIGAIIVLAVALDWLRATGAVAA